MKIPWSKDQKKQKAAAEVDTEPEIPDEPAVRVWTSGRPIRSDILLL